MQLSEKTKRFLSVFCRFGLSAVLLGYLYTKIDVEKTFEIVKTAKLIYFLYALIVFRFILSWLFYN